MDANPIFEALDVNLQQEVIMHLSRGIVDHFPLLRNERADVVNAVVKRMKPFSLGIDEVVCSQGEAGEEM